MSEESRTETGTGTETGTEAGTESRQKRTRRTKSESAESRETFAKVDAIEKSSKRPEAEAEAVSESEQKAEPKPKPKPKTRRKAKTKAGLDLSAAGRRKLCDQICALHAAAGVLLHQPELLKISQDEGTQLTDALLDVFDQYDVSINPKVVCWLNLVGVCAAVYMPRIMLYKVMQQAAKQQHQQPAQSDQTDNGKVDDVLDVMHSNA